MTHNHGIFIIMETELKKQYTQKAKTRIFDVIFFLEFFFPSSVPLVYSSEETLKKRTHTHTIKKERKENK